jgi:hypothetical protein
MNLGVCQQLLDNRFTDFVVRGMAFALNYDLLDTQGMVDIYGYIDTAVFRATTRLYAFITELLQEFGSEAFELSRC